MGFANHAFLEDFFSVSYRVNDEEWGGWSQGFPFLFSRPHKGQAVTRPCDWTVSAHQPTHSIFTPGPLGLRGWTTNPSHVTWGTLEQRDDGNHFLPPPPTRHGSFLFVFLIYLFLEHLLFFIFFPLSSAVEVFIYFGQRGCLFGVSFFFLFLPCCLDFRGFRNMWQVVSPYLLPLSISPKEDTRSERKNSFRSKSSAVADGI